jgi:putative spermidine/putrescine transport system ATP-binding protein
MSASGPSFQFGPNGSSSTVKRLLPDAHTLKAEVLEFIYMGDIYRTRLRVAGNDDFIVKTRNAPDQRRLKPGEMIEIGWRPQDCRALDA